jgi:uncharacterized protein
LESCIFWEFRILIKREVIIMKYRPLGRTGLKVSEIAIGTEYLVNAPKSIIKEVVQKAVEAGCNYFDILFDNPDYLDGFGEALEGIRDKVIIAAHLPTLDSIDKCKAKFNDFMNRVKCGYVDVLFISCCDREEVYEAVTDLSGELVPEIKIRTLGQDFQLLQHGGHLKFAKELQEKGLARHLGFSTHVLPTAMRAIKDGYFDVLMFPINPIFDTLPGKAGAEELNELWDLSINHDKVEISTERKELHKLCMHTETALIAMKPFAAGWLFNPELNAGITSIKIISYILSQSGVTTMVPGVANLEQLEDCLKYIGANDEEKDFSEMISKLRWNPKDCCMYCSHCQPCSSNIDIAKVNKLYDSAVKYGMNEKLAKEYNALDCKADSCIACGDCIKRCPFGIDARDRMIKAAELFKI